MNRAGASHRRLIAGLVLLASFAGCSSEPAPETRLAELSRSCLVNSDCAEPLVCAFQRCHVECITTRDCDGNLRCVGAHERAQVCQLELEASCKTSADCAPGFVCSGDGACRDVCVSDRQCVGEQLCIQGVCAEPTELDESGKLPQLLPLTTCRLNSDCAEGSQCVGGACLPQCVTDRDCAATQACVDGACRAAEPTCTEPSCACVCRADVDCGPGETCDGCACRAAPSPECSEASDCKTGELCVDGACACSCVQDRDCPELQVCDGCACQPAPASSRVLPDATVTDSIDAYLMRDVVEVENRLLLSGLRLSSTIGMERLATVGSLEIVSAPVLTVDPNLPDAPEPLVGLANLKLIRGNLRISNTPIGKLSFNPELQIGGSVTILSTAALTCADINVFEKTLRAHGFQGSFTAQSTADCPYSCGAGQCFFPP